MELSWIQKHALLILLRQQEAQVKEMKPRDVETNLFAYHIDRLVAAHLLEKSERGIYRLTPKGQRLASKFSTETDGMTEEIKTVIMFFAKRDSAYLLYKWNRQPLMHKMTPLYDHFKFGQSLADGLATAFSDKLATTVPITYKTTAFARVHLDDFVVVHLNLLVYEADVSSLTFPLVSRNGSADFVELDHPDVMDGIKEFMQRIEQATEPFEVDWWY